MVGSQQLLPQLPQRAQGLVAYLIQNGMVMKDGDTFGISATQHIAIRLRESERFNRMPVIAATLRGGPAG